MQEYISAPYMFSSRPYKSCTNYGIMNYNTAHAGPDLGDCGGGCSCLLLLHPSLQLTLMLVQMFAPCACAVSLYQVLQIYAQSISKCVNTA